jgi:hypothetical protein
MYLVDLGIGKETLFRSSSELAEAIRRGVVGEQCRIYHRTRAVWLPITVHPAFRQFAARDPGLTARRHQWTFMPAGDAASEASVAVPESPPTAPDVVMAPPAQSWRRTLGSAFRYWSQGHH